MNRIFQGKGIVGGIEGIAQQIDPNQNKKQSA